MDTKQLRYFIEVCEKGSFSKAAESIFISQQALSASILRLEEELNTSLFTRTTRGVYPTKYGIYVKEQARQILNLENKMKQGLNDLRKFEPNIILGCSYGVVGELAGKLLNRTELLNQEIQLKIIEYTELDCEKAVRQGDVDFGLAIGPIDTNVFDSKFIMSRKCCFIVPPVHPLANRKTITIEQLKNEDIIIVNERFKVNHIFQSICREHRVPVSITYETGEIAPIQKVILQNYGVGASIDFVAKKFDPKEISTIYLDDPSYCWNVYLIYKKNTALSEIRKRFIQYLVNESAPPA